MIPPSQELEWTIRLDHWLQHAQVVGTGGQAKLVIQGGDVMVNGAVETRRRRQLRAGDTVEFDGESWTVEVVHQ